MTTAIRKGRGATTAAYPGHPRRVELTGTEGTVIIEGDRMVASYLRTPPADAPAPSEASANLSVTSRQP